MYRPFVIGLVTLIFCECFAENDTSSEGQCTLHASSDMGTKLSMLLKNGAGMVYMSFYINENTNSSAEDSSGTFRRLSNGAGALQPWIWLRSTSQQGGFLLVLHDDVLSTTLFSLFLVEHLDVTLTSEPQGCVYNLSSHNLILNIRTLLLTGIKNHTITTAASPGLGEQICNKQIKTKGDNEADFVYMCCHLSREEDDQEVTCAEVVPGQWIRALLVAVLTLKVLIVLYSPLLVRDAVSRKKFEVHHYVYRVPSQQRVIFKMACTNRPWLYLREDKIVPLRKLPAMSKLAAMVKTWQKDCIYDVSVRDVRMVVSGHKLLGENDVPVGVFRFIYKNLFLCHLRHLSPLTECCNTGLFCSPGSTSHITWFKCIFYFARVLLLSILALPWIFRIVIYFRYERPIMAVKIRIAEAAGLQMPTSGSFTTFLTLLHLTFLICYVILGLDSLFCGTLSTTVRKRIKIIMQRYLRGTKECSMATTCGWMSSVLVLPFTYLGCLGLLILPFYLFVFLPLLLAVLAVRFFPAVNVTCRLLCHIFTSVCPSWLAQLTRSAWNRVTPRAQMLQKPNTLTSESSVVKGKSELLLQIFVLMLLLVSLWSITLLLMDFFGFLVNMIMYTMEGIIVTADVTSQYLSILTFIMLYTYWCSSAIHTKYKEYHKTTQHQLLAMVQGDIQELARSKDLNQQNTALRVQGTMAPPTATPPVVLQLKDGRLWWSTSSVLLFLDKQGTPYTPETFFHQTIHLNCRGCPGSISGSACSALGRLSRIVVFLLSTFIALMAFCTIHSVSLAVQLLGTVAIGVTPFALSRVLVTPRSDVDTESAHFASELHKAVNNFQQDWPVYDLSPEECTPECSQHASKDVGDPEKFSPLDVLLNSSSTINSTLTSAVPLSDTVSTFEGLMSVLEERSLDLIIDVSETCDTSMSKSVSMEIGSQSMLSRNGSQSMFNQSDFFWGRGELISTRLYLPMEESLYDSDEFVDA